MPANAPHAVQAKENLAFVLALSEQSAKKQEINPKSIDIVQSTAPLLKQHGKTITSRMYEIMFDKYPEVKAKLVWVKVGDLSFVRLGDRYLLPKKSLFSISQCCRIKYLSLASIVFSHCLSR